MTVRNALYLVLVCTLPLFAATAQAQTEMAILVDESKNSVKRLTRELQSVVDSCRIGVKATPHLKVQTRANWQPDIKVGDRILKVAGIAVATADEVLHEVERHTPAERLIINVDRDGSEKQLALQCASKHYHLVSLLEINRRIARKEFKACFAAVREMAAKEGATVFAQWTYLNCGFHGRQLSQSDLPTAAFDLARLRVEDVRWDPQGLSQIRADVFANQGYFEKRGLYRLHAELETMFDHAVNEASTPQRVAPSSVATDTEPSSTGTGFIVSEAGVIVTSNHVVDEARKILVRFGDGVSAEATVSARSGMTDIAVLETGKPRSVYLGFAPPRSSRVGASVFTYGFPVSGILGNEPKYTDGTISALSGVADDHTYFQMSVPIQPGNSGGPVVDQFGNVVGIVAATAAVRRFFDSTGALPQNVNWAVKAEYATLLLTPVQPPPAVQSKDAAVQRVHDAIVHVEVYR